MASIRAYTTIEQSRKLAEILSLESADMYWWSSGKRYYIEAMDDGDFNEKEGHVRAWSLAALLGTLAENKICHYDDRYYCQYMSEGDEFPIYSTAEYDNPVDACVAMIEKLNELKML